MPDADPDDTLALTTAMAAGDAAAVAAFYRSWFGFLFAAARRALGGTADESARLDVVQDATLRIVRAVRPIASTAQLRAWVMLVVRTTAYDHLRAAGRRRRHEAAVGLPVGTVDGRLRRAVSQLRRRAAEAFDDDLA